MKGKELSFALLQKSAKSAQGYEKKSDSGWECRIWGQQVGEQNARPPTPPPGILHECQNKGVKKFAIRM